MPDFFSVFDVPVSFDLDLADLEKRYFAVQRVCHPDRLVGKPPAERQQAIFRSMQANEAYEALKDPLLRARHMLALQGIQVCGEKDTVKPMPALLMEIMELREQIDDAKPQDIQNFIAKSQTSIAEEIKLISRAFGANDIVGATHAVLKLGYLLKIAEDLRIKSKTL